MSIVAELRDRLAWRYHCVNPCSANQLAEHGATLVDVRRTEEWSAGHAPLARHIPLEQLQERLAELPEHRPVILVSRYGRRATRAAAFLAGQGLHASNVTGGMRAWARDGLPVVGPDQAPGSVH